SESSRAYLPVRSSSKSIFRVASLFGPGIADGQHSPRCKAQRHSRNGICADLYTGTNERAVDGPGRIPDPEYLGYGSMGRGLSGARNGATGSAVSRPVCAPVGG